MLNKKTKIEQHCTRGDPFLELHSRGINHNLSWNCSECKGGVGGTPSLKGGVIFVLWGKFLCTHHAS